MRTHGGIGKEMLALGEKKIDDFSAQKPSSPSQDGNSNILILIYSHQKEASQTSDSAVNPSTPVGQYV